MPKERRRSLKEALTCSSSPLSGKERQGHCSSAHVCNERLPMASARLVPQLTVTADEGSGTRQLEYEEAEGLNGGTPLRRKLSNSSVSSTGSSVGLEESEDDVLSDNETKSKGIVTLEHLADTGEVGVLREKKKLLNHRGPSEISSSSLSKADLKKKKKSVTPCSETFCLFHL